MDTTRETVLRSAAEWTARWLRDAIRQGEVYYLAETSRSGMSGTVEVCCIRNSGDSSYLSTWWPRFEGCPGVDPRDGAEIIAREVGFSLKHRCFVVKGAGFDRVFDVIETLVTFVNRYAEVNFDPSTVVNNLRRVDMRRRD
jgi:hypothetical protein